MPVEAPAETPKMSEPSSPDDFDTYFKENFNTKLSPEEEAKFNKWAESQLKKTGRDVREDMADYDIKGFWKQGGKFANNGHGSDKFKKPNHPTFSDQSQYHGTESPFGGVFIGGKWGKDSFTPSKEMLNKTHPVEWLKGYMSKVEKGYKLKLPD